jgi:formate C-acetyltransferase
VKSQDGAAMSIGRLSGFFDVYAERDFAAGPHHREDAQEIIDALVTKLRIVRFLRTIDYDQIFSGDPYWATWSDGGLRQRRPHAGHQDVLPLLQTLRNLGPAPEPNITIYWDPKLPEGYKDFCAQISIETSAIQYESDAEIRAATGATTRRIACCVSPMAIGKQMQFFGARAELAPRRCSTPSTAAATRCPASRSSPATSADRGDGPLTSTRCGPSTTDGPGRSAPTSRR